MDEGAIVLDLRTAKYLAISTPAVPELLRSIGAIPRDQTGPDSIGNVGEFGELVDSLITNRILTRSAVAGRRFKPVETRADRSLYLPCLATTCHPGVRDIASFMISVLLIKGLLLTASLKRVLAMMQKRKEQIATDEGDWRSAEIRVLVNSFLRARTYAYSADDHCLFDSLVLMDFLLRHQIAASLVFGVHTKPFRAHAWVQLGNSVLNDHVENVQAYRPIFSI